MKCAYIPNCFKITSSIADTTVNQIVLNNTNKKFMASPEGRSVPPTADPISTNVSNNKKRSSNNLVLLDNLYLRCFSPESGRR